MVGHSVLQSHTLSSVRKPEPRGTKTRTLTGPEPRPAVLTRPISDQSMQQVLDPEFRATGSAAGHVPPLPWQQSYVSLLLTYSLCLFDSGGSDSGLTAWSPSLWPRCCRFRFPSGRPRRTLQPLRGPCSGKPWVLSVPFVLGTERGNEPGRTPKPGQDPDLPGPCGLRVRILNNPLATC